MHKIFYFLVIGLRVLMAPIIFVWPVLSVILSLILDLVDADFAHHVVSKNEYQLIDKTLDFWVYIFEITYAWIHFPKYIFLLFILLVWRFIGMMIFYLANNRKIFIIFANHFESLFYLVFFATYFQSLNFLINSQRNLLIFFSILFVLRVFLEWFIHVADLSVREDFFRKKRRWQ